MFQGFDDVAPVQPARTVAPYQDDVGVPEYLRRHYWWAYIHPKAVQFFDRRWLINLILLGNYKRLRDAALAEFTEAPIGRVLQVACAYGDLTGRLAKRCAKKCGAVDVVDVLPIQLKNLKWKMPARARARMLLMDSADLRLADRTYDWVVLFFLLHEQPAAHRARTLSEAFRVLKPNGNLLIVDYARPRWWNPLRYLWWPLLALLEPFALDLWRADIASLLPPGAKLRRESYFGGFYQKVVVTRGADEPRDSIKG